ncbi:guanine nucleotide binding protein alpha subunit [Fomitiporia mediterranea MF3/22]|uniref:guanine nucleotide binding protein alpha subunit n=1 Tax=Fomitiporia mediterranea (strain MF3/22) TaxID=694068 RepID=UPI000440801D|nr:guanine nucleotide binding protein alpha subunit [Fomitiporia mediterranea MF3/22]EJD06518.1 guanine nucleotide binding protein alpha subunit [Fomitiporia mediterranea MF3/22]
MIRTQTRTSSIYSADDPLALALKPPPLETDHERELRIAAEHEAKRISDRIDEELRQEREAKRRANMQVKLLLLGQAESGKSTLQKQFQLFYAPASLDEERASWRAVVYFNVVRNIKRILQALEALNLGSPHSTSVALPSTAESSLDAQNEAEIAENDALASAESEGGLSALDNSTRTELATLRLRLSPLLTAEASLADRLSGGVQVGTLARRRGGGVYVRSGWQTTMSISGNKRRRDEEDVQENNPNAPNPVEEELNKIARMLFACRDDVKALWAHRVVRTIIDRRKLRLQESAEHFLSGIDRVSAADYTPSTDDILRVRLQTMGIASHEFMVQVSGKSVIWHLYDVGGARGQRHTWVPYFDDANAIIFLAPVSAFDQYLEEEPKTNRINDSLQLFTMICSNELLKKVHLVLFLNKTDVLKQKLAAGVHVKRYIPSYGDRANTYEAVIDYFRTHFLQVHRKNNEEHRVLYTHQTSVVDTSTTQSVIRNVRDSIFRGYLQEASLV